MMGFVANIGVKCSRSRAIGKYGSSKSKELAEELKKMDVYCNYHPPHCGCSDRCWCSQALEKQECLRKQRMYKKNIKSLFTALSESVLFMMCVFFYQETNKPKFYILLIGSNKPILFWKEALLIISISMFCVVYMTWKYINLVILSIVNF